MHIETWFANDSEGADYGTFECQKCGAAFNYSPRDIYDGAIPITRGLCMPCAEKISRQET